MTMKTDLPLELGVAETTINPRLGMQIDGNIGAYRPAEVILNDLTARVVVFQQGQTRFLLVVMDLLAVCQEWTEAIRAFAATELGFDRDAVAVHVTQNHSSPSLGQIMLTDRFEAAKQHPWIRGSDPAYGELVLQRLQPAMRQAAASVQPVRLLCATTCDSRVAFNRRIVMRDGSAEMGLGPKPQNALYREGPSDPEVGVALFTTPALATIAALLHHTCHPVHWTPQTAIHSDWPGAWAAEVRRRLLPGATPLVLNGCCGNVIHRDAFNPHREDTPQSMADILTEDLERALREPLFHNDHPILAWKTVRFGIPFREFPAQVFQDAHALLKEHPEPLWTNDRKTRFEWRWHFAASLVDLEQYLRTHEQFEYEIQALRIGDLAILVLPGEPFVEAQLEIKRRSPAARTFIAHMSNRYVGYIPTRDAIRRGGYETTPSSASKLAPEAHEMIIARSVALLHDLYPDGAVRGQGADRP